MQPVIQSGTAIYGNGFSGGALNRVQKPVRVHKKILTILWKIASKKLCLSVRILANPASKPCVAAITVRKAPAAHSLWG
jgi:hypothetical protein